MHGLFQKNSFKKFSKQKFLFVIFIIVSLNIFPVRAALTWPTCKDLVDSNFKVIPIATRTKDTVDEPMKMAFDLLAMPTEDAKGKVDVYFTERLGKVRKFDSKTSKVITLATMDLNIDQSNSSDGVLGIALDPNFKSNNYVYLYYSYISTATTNPEKNWRVSRFTLNAAHEKLDLASEIPVIKIPIRGGSRHPGGAIKFDAYGDLWITTGNDYYDGKDFPVWSSSNTNDLRGKILRIHPTADGKYTIPLGNLFPTPDSLTKPEIYIMGTRNPYTLALDPVRRWALWGDVGPDNFDADGKPMNDGGSTDKTEEYDLAQAPGNYGYPFFAGANFKLKSGIDPTNPTIPDGADWNNTKPGRKTLPPAIPAIYAYYRSCAITGPLYRYNGDLNSSVKFPPHFNRKWLVTDYNGDNSPIKVFTLSADGKNVDVQDVVNGVKLHGPLDVEDGPDGAIYVNNYAGNRNSTVNTGLVRIEYHGDCYPSTPKLETVDPTSIRFAQSPFQKNNLSGEDGFAAGSKLGVFKFVPSVTSYIELSIEGLFELTVYDLKGNKLEVITESQGLKDIAKKYELASIQKPGIYFISLKAQGNKWTEKIVH